MQYPLISEYVKAIIDSSENLDELNNLKPIMDSNGEPLHSSGAYAVVFKMIDEDTGEIYALKCFTEDQIDRDKAYDKISEEIEHISHEYIINVHYYEKELFVDSSCTLESEFPVLLMDWVDGVTMDEYILLHYKNKEKMEWLTYNFCEMAAWLHYQIFAHGDIKPDNIMVKADGKLLLIDYDGMYVPKMKGMKSPTLGSKDFAHPLRTIDDFNEYIDDFSLASISLSLRAITLDFNLYNEYGTSDGMLLRKDDYLNPGKSVIFKKLCSYLDDTELCKLYGNFFLAFSQKNLALHSFHNFCITKPN